MITKQQAIEAREFHYGECIVAIGPRGGEYVTREVWRRNGQTKTWKTHPDEWQVPVKYGLYRYRIDEIEADRWHTAEDCNPTEVKYERP